VKNSAHSANEGSVARAVAVFAAVLLIVWLIPEGRFFAFSFARLAAKSPGNHGRLLLSTDQGACYDALQWSMATVLFAIGARKFRTAHLVPLACVAIVAVVVIVNTVLQTVGFGFYRNLGR
jgi:hypothetical protein